ncbi:MAG TPA: hypothetical protein VN844_15215 [Pyrinomonadaceae bacterium]|nr:hypothetical protein [Pyrinomonadaceae bacterium]
MSQPMSSAVGAAQTLPEVVGSWTLTIESCVAELNELNTIDITRDESTGVLQGSVADLVGPDQLLKRDLHDARLDSASDIKFTIILDLLPPKIYTFTGSVDAGTMGGTIDGPSCIEGRNHNEEVGTWSATAQPGQGVPPKV